jgi:hypothetical protein
MSFDGEARLEGVQMLNFSRVAERLQDRLEPIDVLLDRLPGMFGFACSLRGRFIGICHYGPVGCIGGLRELHVEVRRKPTRVDQLHEGRLTPAARD